MEALITLLLIILFSIIVNKVATAALVRTGLSKEVASFQAQSAFSGTGFTTSESEYVVSHPVRRRIIRLLILFGSAGLTSAIATLVLTFIGQPRGEAIYRLGILAVGLVLLYVFASSKTIDRIMGRIIDYMLDKFTSIRVVDYEALLGIGHGYMVSSFKVSDESWLAGKTLRETRLRDEGVVVLGIYRRRNGKLVYIGAPGPETRILPGDELIVYGPEEVIASLAKRIAGPLGDLEHAEMVWRQHVRKQQEET
ncbi:MAG: TrkA C-terminal domain-containing protein [Desulfurococcales archaeon]|nr:TrkA C-terminal domain-containing protein [Desulfurococcales archaeon]